VVHGVALGSSDEQGRDSSETSPALSPVGSRLTSTPHDPGRLWVEDDSRLMAKGSTTALRPFVLSCSEAAAWSAEATTV
jgi:hypothetical protein